LANAGRRNLRKVRFAPKADIRMEASGTVQEKLAACPMSRLVLYFG